jgi:hypothetical protein
MNGNWKGGLLTAALVVLVGCCLFLANRPRQALAEEGKASVVSPRYTVIDTEGTNLIITDNQENVLYFYTVDREEKPGSPLKLRASLDLKDVGKPALTPKMANP